FMFILDEPDMGGAGGGQLAFAKEGAEFGVRSRAFHVTAAHPPIHGVTANTWHGVLLRTIGGATKKPDLAGVRVKAALLDRGLVGGVLGTFHVTAHPAVFGIRSRPVLWQSTVVVGGIHLNGQAELAQVALAIGALAFEARDAESRQEQRREDRYDRDNDQ